ncbi:uncharacterized protein LOC135482471 isoform X2 [Lineus longissimus]|uniref:uncharacterized protein LOC135482471 isoform X2 n=1 Tax=Lineus longissimus TaxID=88925 RepID=UPI002B4EA937
MSDEDGCKCYVGNLDFNVGDDELRHYLESQIAGAVIIDCKVITDRDTDRSRGFGFVTFDSKDTAKLCCDLDGQDMKERALKINLATNKRSGGGGYGRGGGGYGGGGGGYGGGGGGYGGGGYGGSGGGRNHPYRQGGGGGGGRDYNSGGGGGYRSGGGGYSSGGGYGGGGSYNSGY